MAGNANSGRRGGLTALESKFRMSTIAKAWQLIAENLENPDLDLKFRLELAAKHTVKSIPTELSGDVGLQLTAMGTIVKDGDNLQFNIGSKIEADVSDPPQDT